MIFVFTPDYAWADRLMYEAGYNRREWRYVSNASQVLGYKGEGHSVVTDGQLSLEQWEAFGHLASHGIGRA